VALAGSPRNRGRRAEQVSAQQGVRSPRSPSGLELVRWACPDLPDFVNGFVAQPAFSVVVARCAERGPRIGARPAPPGRSPARTAAGSVGAVENAERFPSG
jgi:hypothetical protein